MLYLSSALFLQHLLFFCLQAYIHACYQQPALWRHLQVLAQEVLDRCDGNLLAVTILGKALKHREQLCGWQQIRKDFVAELSNPNAPTIPPAYKQNKETVVGAITAAAHTLSKSAAAAFSMLQLLQVHHQLPLPLLQLLWANCKFEVPPGQVDVSPCLNELVEASLLYKVG
jgi:hypothetical protein